MHSVASDPTTGKSEQQIDTSSLMLDDFLLDNWQSTISAVPQHQQPATGSSDTDSDSGLGGTNSSAASAYLSYPPSSAASSISSVLSSPSYFDSTTSMLPNTGVVYQQQQQQLPMTMQPDFVNINMPSTHEDEFSHDDIASLDLTGKFGVN